jgi:NAD+ synthase (glutamine-hydrolysing)
MVTIAVAQLNLTVGDLKENAAKITHHIRLSESSGADIVVFPELAVTGYPPEDLLLKPKFVRDNLDALKAIANSTGDIICVVGFVDKKEDKLFNAAAVIYKGKICGVYHKMLLPNYGVFDEKRYFSAGDKAPVFKVKGLTFGVNICEDIWFDYGPVKAQAKAGAQFILNLNASPYHIGKGRERARIVSRQAAANNVPIAYVNLIGGQDELVFDGSSMVFGPKGKLIARAQAFKEDLMITSFGKKGPIAGTLDMDEEVYQALLLGVKDYVLKNSFKKVAIGLSGGIDSALVATLALDALGKENVTGVFMPTRYSSRESEEDARQLAENLGIKFIKVSVEQIYNMYLLVLDPLFAGSEKNIAEENIQARIRGNILMALSNKFGWLVLTTGNKSEMSTGYATLYGDMAGGFAVIKDVPKTLVYKLSRYRNARSFVIPERIITKEPTAELKPNQKDSDTLPRYEKLDPILKGYVEDDLDLIKIAARCFDKETISRVIAMVDKSEYKRRQSPPGIKITPKAFGRDRRMPITNGYGR